MKVTKAFSLEEDVVRGIEEYKKSHNLGSLSSALERIILIELPKRTDLQEIKDMISDLKDNYSLLKEENTASKEQVITKENIQIENNFLAESFKQTENDMPD